MMSTNKIHLFSAFTLLTLSKFLLHPCSSATVDPTSPYLPADYILLNCGSSFDGPDAIGRNWTGDVRSKFAPSSDTTILSGASTQPTSVSQVPYMTARIFRSQFTFTFPVTAGRKFIRLYFYAASYRNFPASNAIFSVTTANYTLLHNFNPWAWVNSALLNSPSFTREFSFNSAAGFLNLTFTPNSSVSDAYAFVNGIEIVSMPDIFNTGEARLVGVGIPSLFTVQKHRALETVSRLNVGGNYISPVQDSGLYRSWSNDDQYVYGAAAGVTFSADPGTAIKYTGVPAYIAPENVYATARSMGPDPEINLRYNLTWTFRIDSGFQYLIRLHFCGIQSTASFRGARVFKIFINNEIADEEMDVLAWTRGDGIPLYKDYVLLFTGGNGFTDLSVSLHPNTALQPVYYDAFLNGIEIFKLSSWEGNLAGISPILTPKHRQESSNSADHPKKIPILVPVYGVVGAIAAVVVIGLLVLAVSWSWRGEKNSDVKRFNLQDTEETGGSMCGEEKLLGSSVQKKGSESEALLGTRMAMARIGELSVSTDDDSDLRAPGGNVFLEIMNLEGR